MYEVDQYLDKRGIAIMPFSNNDNFTVLGNFQCNINNQLITTLTRYLF